MENLPNELCCTLRQKVVIIESNRSGKARHNLRIESSLGCTKGTLRVVL